MRLCGCDAVQTLRSFWSSIKGVFTQADGPVNPFVFSWKLPTDPIFWRWGAAFARNCAVGYKARIGFLDVYGRFCVHALHETVMAEGIAAASDYRRAGSLVVYEGKEEWESVANQVRRPTVCHHATAGRACCFTQQRQQLHGN